MARRRRQQRRVEGRGDGVVRESREPEGMGERDREVGVLPDWGRRHERGRDLS